MFQRVTIGSTLAILAVILAAMPLAAAGQATVNINTAGVEQLMLLPRVGPSVAQRIVDFREANGRFKTVDDLMLVQGIGEKTFELIRPHITIDGETTLTEKVVVPKSQSEDS